MEDIQKQIEEYNDHPNYHKLPNRIIAGLLRYRDHKKLPGDFLCSALKNDLAQTVGRADGEMQYLLKELMMFIWNEMPAVSWGSEDHIENYLKNG